MEKKKSKLSAISISVAVLACLAFIVYFIFISCVNNVEIFSSSLSGGYKTVSDYTCTEIKDESAPAGVVKEYRFTVPQDVFPGDSLAFYTAHQYSETYMDGELVYSIVSNGNNNIKTVGCNWIVVPLSVDDIGKEITIKITPVYKGFINRGVDFIIGDDISICISYLLKDVVQLVLCAISSFIGVLFIGIGFWSIRKKNNGEEMIMLGVLAIMVGVWRFTDTRFVLFIFKNNHVPIFYLSIFLLMFALIPFIRLVRYRHDSLGKTILDIYSIVVLGVNFVQLALQIFGVADIRENLILTHILIIVGIIIIILLTVRNKIVHLNIKKINRMDLLPFICVIGAAADLIIFYLKGNSSYLICTLSTFVIYILYTGVVILIDYSERGKILAEQEKELLQSHIDTMLSQIKPHFIYNSLSSISELCVTDPERARDAIADFSTYLRGNMDFTGGEQSISFIKELKHIECYLNLEKMRFGSRLNIVYDIREENFFIPPLTIQPLVENAVKHGVCAKKDGGTVTLATRRDGDKVIITVTDDGVGFDKENIAESKDGAHIGLVNVRNRLEQMVGATLTLQSEKGKGTVATVVIYDNLKKGE